MNNFKKLQELQDSLKNKGYKEGDKMKNSDYIESVNKVFNLNATEKDIPFK